MVNSLPIYDLTSIALPRTTWTGLLHLYVGIHCCIVQNNFSKRIMNKVEIKSLTGVRGLAALFVVFHHWHYFLLNNSILSPSSKHYLTILFNHGNWSVDLFFILSGFLLSITSYNEFNDNIDKTNYFNFIIKRFCRVYPIYIALAFCYFIAELLFTKHNTDILTIAVNLTLFQSLFDIKNINPLAWSLSIEWAVYFLLPIMFVLFNKINSKYARVFTLYILSISIILFITKSLTNPYYRNHKFLLDNIFLLNQNYVSIITTGYYPVLRGLASYLLGIATFSLLDSGRLKLVPNSLFYLLTLIQIALLFSTSLLANTVFILLIPFMLIGLTRDHSLLSKLFSTKPIYFLGEISFSLYLLHFVFVMSISPRIEKFLMQRHVPHYKYILFFSLLSIVVALSSLLYYYLEKPLNVWFRKRLLLKQPQNKLILQHSL
ncbi:acyltransferase family protein [Hymenobacter sp. GOD-10R]|uniref:acyltransferase family protein n=1 Tax=Hymenobacter sp. GOD-10R TaxID=3093922 RepID=UPI003A5CED50